MKSDSKCFVSLMEQAYSVVAEAADDEEKRFEIMQGVSAVLSDVKMDSPSAKNRSIVMEKVYSLLDGQDPFSEVKAGLNEKMVALVPALLEKIKGADDKLEMAVKIAAAGNAIGSLPEGDDLEGFLNEKIDGDFPRFDLAQFKEKLGAAERVLYIMDNAGEIICDRILIEGLKAHGKMVLAAVASSPMLTDATMEDAQKCGLDKIIRMMDKGNNSIGIDRDKCSEMFLKVLDSADMVIAKGQANYETLPDIGDRCLFMMALTDKNVSESLGVDEGDLVLISG